MNLDYIKSFFSRHTYDVRKSGDARWIDQKRTNDLLWDVFN